MNAKIDPEFVKKSGQEMYFDRDLTLQMIERENNVEHVLVSKIFESILMVEFEDRYSLRVADLGAGAHTMRYKKFIEFLAKNKGKIYWVDQSLLMLDYAFKNTPEELKSIFEFINEEMVYFLKNKQQEFDGLILKYSLNYMIPGLLENWFKLMYKSLKKGGKVIANSRFHERKGMKERSYNAIHKVEGKMIKAGYKPKDTEVIEILFLERAGDNSENPKTFASTKIVYYSPQYIKNAAYKAGFDSVLVFENWEKNKKWKTYFEELNPNLESKPKSFLLLQK